MKLPATFEKYAAKFDAMSVRERVLVSGAVAIAAFMIWTIAIFDPISDRERALLSEMSSIQESIASTIESLEAGASSNPLGIASRKEHELKQHLAQINSELNAQSAGLIPPERIVELIHDVLSKQRGVKLISLHNRPVTALAGPSETSIQQEADSDAATAIGSGPYMHPVELVIEGRYLDVMNYLRELESLPWHFYWKQLDLQSTQYPLNRVRIELGTLSMDKEWIGV